MFGLLRGWKSASSFFSRRSLQTSFPRQEFAVTYANGVGGAPCPSGLSSILSNAVNASASNTTSANGTTVSTSAVSRSVARSKTPIILVGFGRLGMALVFCEDFSSDESEFQLVGVFDIDPSKVGQPAGQSLQVESANKIAETVCAFDVEKAILAVPSHAAQTAADALVRAGIYCIVNMSSHRIKVPEDVEVVERNPAAMFRITLQSSFDVSASTAGLLTPGSPSSMSMHSSQSALSVASSSGSSTPRHHRRSNMSGMSALDTGSPHATASYPSASFIRGMRRHANAHFGLRSILFANMTTAVSRTSIAATSRLYTTSMNSSRTLALPFDSSSSLASTQHLLQQPLPSFSAAAAAHSITKNVVGDSLPLSAAVSSDLSYDRQRYLTELKDSIKNVILNKKPTVRFSDVAGNAYAKQILTESTAFPNAFSHFVYGQVQQWRRVLLYGPPGVGKTLIAQALCAEADATCFWVSMSDVTSRWMGESEKLLRYLFETAREHAPSIIFIDEMDWIGRKRSGHENEAERRMKTEFLRQMDAISQCEERVFVLAATNMPWDLDIAALRRFEKRILVPMPDEAVRAKIFELHLSAYHDLTEADFMELGKQSDGYSGSDISTIVKDAVMRRARTVTQATHFKQVEAPRHLRTASRLGTCTSASSVALAAVPEVVHSSGVSDTVSECDCDTAATASAASSAAPSPAAATSKSFWAPADASDPDAVTCSFDRLQVDLSRILPAPVTKQDLLSSVYAHQPTVTDNVISLYQRFLEKYGHTDQADGSPVRPCTPEKHKAAAEPAFMTYYL